MQAEAAAATMLQAAGLMATAAKTSSKYKRVIATRARPPSHLQPNTGGGGCSHHAASGEADGDGGV